MTASIDLSAAELASAIAAGRLDPVEAVNGALARIEAREPAIHAWAHVDREGALAEAGILAAEAKAGALRGPLHGVPIGIKDVFHARELPTLANSATMDGAARYPDSGVVAQLRAAGAVIVGKCTTVEFAGMGEPPATRNPWNTEHTAGGSSSGSGAAVGAKMVPAAIGTQTGGSNLRPAAYNGVAGLKPSYGAFSRRGLLPVSWSLDHPGLITRSASDLALLFGVLSRGGVTPIETPSQWRIGVPRQFFFETSQPATAGIVRGAVDRLGAAGAAVSDVDLPALFSAQAAMHHLIMSPEMATYHAPRLGAQRGAMSPRHAERTAAFSLVPANYYMQALRARRMLRDALWALFETVDVLAMPTAPGPAPHGLDSTGDASLLSPWSLVGFPAATVPCGLAPDGLPLGLQLVGAPGTDRLVIAAAIAAEQVLGRLDLPA